MPKETDAARRYLYQHPETKDQYDEVFGAGAADRALQQHRVDQELDARIKAQGSIGQQLVPEAQKEAWRQEIEAANPMAEPEEGSWFDATDTVGAIPGGVVASFEAQGDLLSDLVFKLGGGKIPLGLALGEDAVNRAKELGKEDADGWFEVIYDPKHYDDAIFGQFNKTDAVGTETHSVSADMVKGVSQFVTSFLTAGKLLGPLKAGAGATWTSNTVRAAGQSGMAGFIGFDPNAPRLSNFINQFPTLENPITEYLAATDEDDFYEGRLKSAIEEVMVGTAAEGVFRIIKSVRKGRRVYDETGDMDAAQKVMAEDAEQLDLFLNPAKQVEAEVAPTLKAAAIKYKGTIYEGTDHVGAAEAAAKKNKVELEQVIDEMDEVDGFVTSEGKFLTREEAVKLRKGEGDPAFATAQDPSVAAQIKAAQSVPLKKTLLNRSRLARARAMGELQADDFMGETGHDWVNWEKYAGGDDLKAVTEEALRGARERLQSFSKDEPMRLREIMEDSGRYLAEAMNMGYTDMMRRFAGLTKNTEELPYLVAAYKDLTQSLAADIHRLARQVDMGVNSIQAQHRLVRRLDILEELMAQQKGLSRNVSRALNAHRNVVSPTLGPKQLSVAEMMDDVSKWGGTDAIKIRAQRMARTTNARDVIKFARKSGLQRALDIHNEFFVNSILSGMKTQFVNILGNGLQTILVPTEKMIGAAFMRDKRLAQEAMYQIRYLATAGYQAAKMATVALRTGNNVLDPHISKYELPMHAIDSSMDNWVGSMIRGTGTVVRMPVRFLMTADEFFAQMNFRADLMSKLEVESWARFGDDVQARTKFIADEFDNAFTTKQNDISWREALTADKQKLRSELGAANVTGSRDVGGRAPSLRADESLDNVRETIFTKDLKDHKGLFGGHTLTSNIQDLVNKAPILRPFIPFTRTPTNLVRTWALHTPGLNLFFRQFYTDIARGGEARAKAIGKIATGMGFYALATNLAMSGHLNGRGPTDPNEAKLARMNGFQPYSFVWTRKDGTKRQVSFNRADPIGMFFGMTADIVYASQHSSDMDVTKATGVLMASFLKNMENKAYFKGVSDLLTGLSEPEDRAESIIRNYFGAYMPTGITDVAKGLGIGFDDTERQAVHWFEGFMSRVPYLNQSLPPKRSWVTGDTIQYPDALMYPDAISPFVVRDRENDPVLEVLGAIEHGFMPPSPRIAGIDLRDEHPDVYDKLIRYTAQPRQGMQGLRDRLERIMGRPSFDLAKEKVLLESQTGGSMIQREVERYKALGLTRLLKEERWLREHVRDYQRTQGRAKRGDRDALQYLRELENK